MSYHIIPPQQCRVIAHGVTYSDGTPVSPSHVLEWRGLVSIRCNPDKDDIWHLECGEKRVEIEVGDLEILGRTPGHHTMREKLDAGFLPTDDLDP